MTQITKDQVNSTLESMVPNRVLIAQYIEQLEAQLQPVSDEKLKEAINSAEFAPESMFGNLVLLPKQQWDVITSALSDMETLRAASKEAQASPACQPIDTLGDYEGMIETWNCYKQKFDYFGANALRHLMRTIPKPECVVFPTHWRPQSESLPTTPALEV